VSFESALRELRDRLAANAGINIKEHRLQSAEDVPAALIPSFQERDERLFILREEAMDWLLGSIITEGLRVWIDQGQQWARPTRPALRDVIFFKQEDEPCGLYVDREEFAPRAAARWPTPAETAGNRTASSSSGRRGRPIGSGSYAEDDAPLLIEMQRLVDDGKALSAHQASLMVADRARGGGSLESKARRLRNAYSAMRSAGG
jgi:hypothetical protein